MAFDAALALRMITNERLRYSQGCEYRDLHGALAVTSDWPLDALNRLGDFTSNKRNIESLLDVGFALLRAFDRRPAAELTPLDRPATISKILRARRMAIASRRSWMAFRGGATAIRINGDVEIRVAEPDDARAFAALHGGSEAWMRRLSLASTLTGMLERGNNFYIGYVEERAVATLHLLCDGATAGIYAVGTAKAHRRQGVCSTLTARAICDAQTAGCDLICLSTDADGYAESLYAKLGFERAFVSELWVAEEI
jgi:ribosomal protein S18 acetylase RimI-like enzyme